MSWITITILAHLLFAAAYIIDKHIVSNAKIKPISYTFYSGIFQILYLALLPFVNFKLPDTLYIIVGVFDGALFILALIIFYKALKLGEASRVVPIIGAAIPIFTVSLSYIILHELLAERQFFAFSFFVFGGILLSSKFSKGKVAAVKGISLAILAGFLFALYYTLMKFLYKPDFISFFDGFMLLQAGGFLGALFLLISRKNRLEIFSAPKTIQRKTTSLFISNKVLAALAAALLSYAISIKGSAVTIINALQAVQYVFILFLAAVLSKKLPSLFQEQLDRNVIAQKIAAIALIGIGLFLLI